MPMGFKGSKMDQTLRCQPTEYLTKTGTSPENDRGTTRKNLHHISQKSGMGDCLPPFSDFPWYSGTLTNHITCNRAQLPVQQIEDVTATQI